jgi:H+/Cl- antiporter ClcA
MLDTTTTTTVQYQKQDLLAHGSMVRQMLVASTSLGVSSVFGATIGGVLLAVEITSTYYLVAQYFKVSKHTTVCILHGTMLYTTHYFIVLHTLHKVQHCVSARNWLPQRHQQALNGFFLR